jgi:outer membrane protein, heavy metal efflux system
MSPPLQSALAASLGLLALGCAHLQPRESLEEVRRLLDDRVEHVEWIEGGTADVQVEAAIDDRLRAPLTAAAAVEIALLNNRRLQATYQALAVAQADLVQAGLLENPVLVGSSLQPGEGGGRALLNVGIVQNLLSILTRPSKKALSEAQLEKAELEVGHAVLQLVSEVEAAYYEAVAARQVVAMHRLISDAADASSEMAQRLSEAGNLSALDEAHERGVLETSRVNLARSETRLVDARERLTSLLGLWGERVEFELPEALPELPVEAEALDGLEALAVQHRLDLAAAGREVEILAAALGVSRNWRWMVVAQIGLDSERELDGAWLHGPSLALELPIFDRRQAQLARLEAELRRSEQNLAAMAVEIRSDVRRQRDRLAMTRRLVEHYRDAIIPLREQIVTLTQERYDFMLTGVFELLMAKRDEYAGYQDYVEGLRDYWQTRTALQRAVGYALPDPPAAELPASSADSTASHHDEGSGS